MCKLTTEKLTTINFIWCPGQQTYFPAFNDDEDASSVSVDDKNDLFEVKEPHCTISFLFERPRTKERCVNT